MIKAKNRADLDRIAGRAPQEPKLAVVVAPPPPPAPTIDPAQLTQMQAAITAMAAGIERTAQLVAQQQKPAAKKLEAIVHRDTRGRMERVEINVIPN